MMFLEERPVLLDFDRLDEMAPTWVATVAGERECLDDQGVRDQLLKVVYKERGAKDALL